MTTSLEFGLLDLSITDGAAEHHPIVRVEEVPIQPRIPDRTASGRTSSVDTDKAIINDAVPGIFGETWYVPPSPKSAIALAVEVRQREFIVGSEGLPEMQTTEWEIKGPDATNTVYVANRTSSGDQASLVETAAERLVKTEGAGVELIKNFAHRAAPVRLEERDRQLIQEARGAMHATDSTSWDEHYRKLIEERLNGPREDTLLPPPRPVTLAQRQIKWDREQEEFRAALEAKRIADAEKARIRGGSRTAGSERQTARGGDVLVSVISAQHRELSPHPNPEWNSRVVQWGGDANNAPTRPREIPSATTAARAAREKITRRLFKPYKG